MARNDADSFATRLYRGEVSFNFIGHRLWWYIGSGIVILVGVVSLAVQGLNPSIDFKGGAQFLGPINGHSTADVTNAVTSTGVSPDVVETVGSGSDKQFNVQTSTLTDVQVTNIESALEKQLGISENQISPTTVGSTWGSQITNKAIEGLIIFLVVVIVYLSIRFEWKMALAAIIALLHDLVITAGIYSLSGLQVSPSTVIALLTILGYSLYDTVVVFDKVRENTASIAGGSRMTFTQATNFAVNQTLVRSINTSVIALLPVIGLLVIGAGVLGAGSLKDLSFALFIGLASGAYSSIFIASPLLCEFKEREPTYQQLAKRVATRRDREGGLGPVVATAAGPIPADIAADVLTPDDLSKAEGEAPRERRTGPPPRAGARPAGRRRPGGGGNRSRKRR
ncbi:MAG TPA: protein translocase subunit SecF [Mycobacteriales bacterium]|jgi:preprotein translocase subunit SecF|nr:protein translocase subunit SecF [Mycobacteriales bacterium]